MSKVSNVREVAEVMDALTPEQFVVKGGQFADYVVALDDKTMYAQAVARVLHANAEHMAREVGYSIEVKSIDFTKIKISGTETPMAVITVCIDSPVFGKRENVMTAILDTDAEDNPISAAHPIEKAVTQAIGRALGLMGFAFTGSLVSAEEVNEGKNRVNRIKNNEKTLDPLEMLKKLLDEKELDFDEFVTNRELDPENIGRKEVFQLLGEARKI